MELYEEKKINKIENAKKMMKIINNFGIIILSNTSNNWSVILYKRKRI